MLTPNNTGWQLCGEDKAVAPDADNDGTEGYSIGSRWFDTTANLEYVCLDASTGTAVWKLTTAAVFGTEYTSTKDDTLSSSASSEYIQKLRLTTASLPAGDYHIQWYAEICTDKQTLAVGCQIEEDDTTVLAEEYNQKSKQDLFYSVAGNDVRTLTGVHTFDLDYKTEAGPSGGVNIQRARLSLWRVS